MEYLLIILLSIPIVLLVMWFSAEMVFILNGGRKYYKTIYKSLPSRIFYLNTNQVYSHNPFLEKDDGFVWFTTNNNFRIVEGHYIHNNYMTRFSPYEWYWLRKYQKWCKENIDTSTIKNLMINHGK